MRNSNDEMNGATPILQNFDTKYMKLNSKQPKIRLFFLQIQQKVFSHFLKNIDHIWVTK